MSKYSLPTCYQQFIHLSRYARWIDNESRRERWDETVDRYLGYMCDEQCHGKIDAKTREELRKAMMSLEVMPSMRCMMTAGPALKRDNIAGFNPVVGSTLFLTREHGLVPIESMDGKTCTVLNKNGVWTQARVRSYGEQPTFAVTVRKNSNTKLTIRCTANHRWVLEDGTVKETSDLRSGQDGHGGDKLPYASASRPDNMEQSLDYRLGVVHGIIYGDGTAQFAQERDKGYTIRLCGDHEDLLPCFTVLPDVAVTYPPSFKGDPVVMLYGNFGKTHALKTLPSDDETDEYMIGFIRGWIAADGAVGNNSSVTLSSDTDNGDWFVRHAPRYGYVVQYVYAMNHITNFGKRKKRMVNMTIDRSSLTADDLIIKRKKDRFRPLKSRFVVAGVEPTGENEKVFCAEVPDTNTFVLDRGLVTGNCTGIVIDNIAAFDEVMYCLTCGAGVGISVERQFIANLPVIAEKMRHSQTIIKVEDSKLGWCNATRELIGMLYHGRIPEWDLSDVRPAGAKLKTFGGRASGPAPLNDLFKFCVETFSNAVGRKLNSLECHDICCKIGEIVVVGGVRRSAILSLSNPSDDRMRYAKHGNWFELTPWRSMANNSSCYTEKPGMDVFFREWLALYESKSGERGIFNRQAAKKQAEKYGRRDANRDFICNPCSEIILRSKQGCNLSEVVVKVCDTEKTLMKKVRLAAVLGTMQATLTDFRYLSSVWKQNTEEEALLGVSLTGIMDNELTSGRKGKTELKDVLNRLREHAVQVNKEWAKKLGINQAAAVTCVKPSGCATLDTRIRTDKGVMSFAEILHMNGVTPDMLQDDTWIVPSASIAVFDRDNNAQPITKLYVNGVKEVFEIEDDEGNTYRFTGNHKLQTSTGWKRVDALSCDDHIMPRLKRISRLPDKTLTVDIEVGNTHSYQLSNGWVSHNTISQLVDCASGIHARFSEYYIRRVRADRKDPLAQMMIDAGFPWEQDVSKPESVAVFSFPVKSPEGAMTADKVSAMDQLELWRIYQNRWCEHKPSCTIYVGESEWMDVGAWVYRHFDETSGISFLPSAGHTYKQAPYESISKDAYGKLVESMPKNVDWNKLKEYETDDDCVNHREIACSGNSCELVDLVKNP